MISIRVMLWLSLNSRSKHAMVSLRFFLVRNSRIRALTITSFINYMAQLLEESCQRILRPPRRDYTIDQLGREQIQIQNRDVLRVDFDVFSRQKVLKASYYIQKCDLHRCAIYLHGNASCRLEGSFHLKFLVEQRINLCVMDFAGCGMSEGEYITMGYYEREDVQALMAKIQRDFGPVDEFILWGRSMGGVTALLLSDDMRITKYIVDSAFTRFRSLLEELGSSSYGVLCKIMSPVLMYFLRRKISEIANFDIDQINPIEAVSKEYQNKRFFFIAGKNDNLINCQHSVELFNACRSEKRLEIYDGDHNSVRPQECLQAIQSFLKMERSQNLSCNSQYNKILNELLDKHQQEELELEQGQIEQTGLRDQELMKYRAELERRSQLESLQQDGRDLSEFEHYM